MRFTTILSTFLLSLALTNQAGAQHAQVSAVAVHPINSGEVWVCNRDNASVSVVDVASGEMTRVTAGTAAAWR